jgi:hypothetical protein
MNATIKNPSGHRWFTSLWALALVSVLVVVAATSLDDRVGKHQRAMSADCGALVKMSTWCDFGYRAAISVGVLSIVLAVMVPVWWKIRGETYLIDAAASVVGRVALTGAATGYAILAFRSDAPYHVPCGGLGITTMTGLFGS